MRVRAILRLTSSALLAHWRLQYLRLSVPSIRRPQVVQTLKSGALAPSALMSRASPATLSLLSQPIAELSLGNFPAPFMHRTLTNREISAITVNRDCDPMLQKCGALPE
jgi:hypothetical protein